LINYFGPGHFTGYATHAHQPDEHEDAGVDTHAVHVVAPVRIAQQHDVLAVPEPTDVVEVLDVL
jgi:hypothetical protein